MPTTRILLARHGETDWNAERRHQGQADRPLNDEGRLQADALATTLATEPVVVVYSSDLRRAQETAERVASRLAVPLVIREALREVDVGELTGLTFPEVTARWPDARERSAEGYAWAGGESFEALEARALGELRQIARAHEGELVLVVAHGALIRVVLAALAGIPIDEHRALVGPIANGALQSIELSPESG